MASHQIRSFSHRRRLLGADLTMIDRVLGFSPIVYYPMAETAGAAAVNAGTLGTAANGTYTGVTLNNTLGPDGVNGAPFFDGVNDYLHWYSAALDAAFNGATGSFLIWAKAVNAGMWTDGLAHQIFSLVDNVNNRYRADKGAAGSIVNGRYIAGGGGVSISNTPYSSTDWFPFAMTWSDANNDDEAKAFCDGAQVGSTSSALNAWAGVGLNSAEVTIGAAITTPTTVWHGWLAHPALFDYVLTPAQIANLSTP